MRSIIIFLLLGLSSLLIATTGNRKIEGKFESNFLGDQKKGNFEFNIAVDEKGFKFTQKLEAFKSEAFFDENYDFKSMYRKMYEDNSTNKVIELTGEDYLYAELSENKKVLNITYELDGKKVRTEKVKIKGEFRIFNNLFLTLQNDLKNGAENFKSYIIFPESAKSYKASFNFYQSSDVLAKETKYNNIPDFFVKGSKFDNEVIVCEVGLLGIASKFFPYKFNFIFKNGGTYKFLGYWGGEPKSSNFYLTAKEKGEK